MVLKKKWEKTKVDSRVTGRRLFDWVAAGGFVPDWLETVTAPLSFAIETHSPEEHKNIFSRCRMLPSQSLGCHAYEMLRRTSAEIAWGLNGDDLSMHRTVSYTLTEGRRSWGKVHKNFCR